MIFSTATDVYLHATEAPQQMGLLEALASMAPLILFIFVIFYFFYQRPMNKERNTHERMIKGLLIGDKVVTIGGIHGEVAKVEDTTVVIKSGDKSRITISKSSIKLKLQAQGE